MTADVRVSIVAVTYNRADELARMLDSLRPALERPDVEIIVVDDASTDGTVARVSAILAPYGERARIVRQEKEGPGAGRNRGIALARGEIVAFLDTDCVAHPGWLDALVAPFADAKVGVAGGPDRSRPDEPLLARLIDYLMTGTLVTGGVRGAKKTHGASYHPRSFDMAVRREAAVAVGGFPTIWYGEDILLSSRIIARGWTTAYAPDAWVYHRRRTSLAGWARQLYRMGRARWWMGRHDRKLLQPLFLLPVLEFAAGIAAVALVSMGGFSRLAGIGMLAIAALFLAAVGIDGVRHVRHAIGFVAAPAMFLLRETAYALGSIAGLVRPLPDLRGKLDRVATDV